MCRRGRFLLSAIAGVLALSCTENTGGNSFDGLRQPQIGFVRDDFDATHPNLEVRTIVTPAGSRLEAVVLSGVVERDLTLVAGVPYLLSGAVLVGADAGASQDMNDPPPVTLTVDPGATIYGMNGDDTLVVSRGASIMAIGTNVDPIVFSSVAEIERGLGLIPADSDAGGEWGGVVINGRAPINNCRDGGAVGGTGACQADGVLDSGPYGGSVLDDNSGSLARLRIEFAGSGGGSSGGLTLQGVGSATSVRYVQVHRSGGDGVAIYGGRVELQYVVVSGAGDDGLDLTGGYAGAAQFVLVIQDEGTTGFAIEVSNSVETGEDTLFPGGNQPVFPTPQTDPVIFNVTLIGAGANQRSIAISDRAIGVYRNFILSGFGGAAFTLGDAAVTAVSGMGNTLQFGSMLVDLDGDGVVDGDGMVRAGARNTLEMAARPHPIDFDYSLSGGRFVPPAAPGPDFMASIAADRRIAMMNHKSEAAAYAGAFSSTETEDRNWTTGWTRFRSIFPGSACPDGMQPRGVIVGRTVCEISGTLTSDTMLPGGGNIAYRLRGRVFVGSDGGGDAVNVPGSFQATLTIGAGVTLFGDGVDDGLTVTRGSRVFARGTADAPIRFTSGRVLRGEYDDIEQQGGHWLGIQINGKAPINRCADASATPGEVGCEANGEANSGLYGGGVADDDSGVLRYVRVEYAGIRFNDADQANGIALQGVGKGTTLDHVQVHNSLDDGIEFFGGTADGKYLIVTGARDDGIDWTDGWTGNLQFAIIEHSRHSDNGFEGDNRNGDPGRLPRSAPNIANFTILGYNGDAVANTNRGMRLRRGTGGSFLNGIVVETVTGLSIDAASGLLAYCTVTSNVQACGTPGPGGTLTAASFYFRTSDQDVVADAFEIAASGTMVAASAITGLVMPRTSDPGGTSSSMTGVTFFGRPGQGLIPGVTESRAIADDLSRLRSPFFENVNFVGAINPVAGGSNHDWHLGWTINARGELTEAP